MDFDGPHQRLSFKRLYVYARAVVRIICCTFNNFYCIPVHFCWLLVLQPLKWVSPSTYWRVEGVMFRWLLSMVALWSYSNGYHVVERGDDVWDLKDERTLVLFNHQSTSDVPLIMAAFNSRHQLFNNIMWIMDHIFKYTNFGLVSWAHGDFFIQGGKEKRDTSLVKLEKHLKNFYIPRKRKWLVLFPEGGFLKNRKSSSKRYALKNNLPVLENVSLPRVGALKVILDTLATDEHNEKNDTTITHLLDVTIAYPGGKPLDLPTIFGGWRPSCDTIFHYRRFKIEEVPKEEEALTQWLYTRYVEKEAILQEYYDTGVFPEALTPHAPGQGENVPRLNGSQVVHDPMEFVLRHCFFLASSYIWVNIIYWIFSWIFSHFW